MHGSIVEHELVNRLLSNYSVNVRPVEHWSEALNVTVDVSLNQIIDLVSHTGPCVNVKTIFWINTAVSLNGEFLDWLEDINLNRPVGLVSESY